MVLVLTSKVTARSSPRCCPFLWSSRTRANNRSVRFIGVNLHLMLRGFPLCIGSSIIAEHLLSQLRPTVIESPDGLRERARDGRHLYNSHRASQEKSSRAQDTRSN